MEEELKKETENIENNKSSEIDNKKPKKTEKVKAKRKKKKLNYRILVVAVIAGFLVGLITFNGWLNTLDFWMTDAMFQPDENPELDIAIIAIDEASIQKMGIYENWKRDIYGKLIEKLCSDECEPAVIAFDILFTSEKDPEADKYFADAAARYGSVIAGIYLDVDAVGDNDEHIITEGTVKGITYPYDTLNQAVAGYGFTNNQLDKDGYFRLLLTQADYQGEKLIPLSLAAYKVYAQKNNIEVREFDEDEKSFLFTYSTDAGRRSGFEVYSISDVLESESYADKTDGKIVLVGAYALGFQDDFFTPAERGARMFGVQIHANEIEAFHQNKLQTAMNDWAVSIIYGILIAVLIVAVYMAPLPIAGVITAGSLIIEMLSCIILYKNGIYLKIAYFILPAVLVIVTAIVMHYLSARAEKAKINNAFKMYVAPEIVDEMATDGKFELKLGGQTKDIAVLFIDIRGFTTMSEKLSPEEVVSILNEYFDLVTDAIFKNKGTIDKFVGDAAMAVFNSPNDLDDYVYRAVHTGWDILLGTQDLMVKLEEKHHRTIGFGIGVNCGPATVGNIGSEFRMDYTAIGDTVNTSARLEANAAAGQILISQDVLDRVSEWVEVEKVEGIKLKGKSNEFNIYNVTKVIDKPGYLESGISIRKKK